MKLFQRLLVAPAALGLLAPISANATEFNLKDISNYSDVDTIEFANSFNVEESTETNLIAGGEGLVNYGDDFSETTTATFSADFAIGAVDGNTSEDAVQGIYGFQIDLNTSFTGDDSFDVSIDAGNGGSVLTELDLNDVGASGTTNDDVLAVDGISYTFPVGDNLTVLVGNDVAGSSLYNTACVYGGITNTLDDCGNASSAMDGNGATALSASYDFGDGFTAAFGYEGVGDGANGLMTKEGLDTYGLQVSYAEEDGQFGASLTYATEETSSTAETTYWGLNGYWTPEDVGAVPSISVGYEVGNPSGSTTDTTHWFLGFQWDEVVGDGTIGAAVGTTEHTADNATEYLMYEAFYSYPINDGMTVTPLIYVKETSGDDETGVIVKTSFSF
jgi:hypothetical protein